MKRYYKKPCLTPFSFGMEGPILKASGSGQPMKMQSVEVEEFDNGFDDTIAPDGFMDIKFD